MNGELPHADFAVFLYVVEPGNAVLGCCRETIPSCGLDIRRRTHFVDLRIETKQTPAGLDLARFGGRHIINPIFGKFWSG